jgi:trk system potassium uptake protein TrkA
MRTVVVGAGEVGSDVARILALEEHDVTVIDNDEDVLRAVQNNFDVLTVEGNGTSAQVLEEAGIREADLLVAVTAVDEVNIIACMMADRLGVETTIARTRTDELERAQSVLEAEDFGIDLVIHPEESAAVEVTQLIQRAGATDVLTFCDDSIQLIGVRLDEDAPVAGRPLHEIVAAHPKVEFRVKALVRDGRSYLPDGDEVLRPGDQIFVLTRPKYATPVIRILGKEAVTMERIMILGGTRVGAGVAKRLSSQNGKRIKLIEPDPDRAQELAEQLPNTLVLNGDPTDIDLLKEEGLAEMDAFAAVTDDQESNLVTCLMAKNLGVYKTVAQLSKAAYIPISEQIGLDAAVSKKLAVAREVRRYLRGTHVKSVATVHGLDAEILEIEASPRAPITTGPLRNLDLPSGLLVGAVDHNDTAEIATGNTEIEAGDRAIVFVLPQAVEAAEALFEA